MKELVLGGARSGKSRFAEQRVEGIDKTLIYLATAEARDGEMNKRIRHHQNRRNDRWQLWEEPIALSNALLRYNSAEYAVLVDCLTLWISNCLHQQCLATEKMALINLLPTLACDVVFVSNEVGSGIIPMGELSRDFVDESGWLHQELAQLCDAVTLVVAGLPLALK